MSAKSFDSLIVCINFVFPSMSQNVTTYVATYAFPY